VSHDLRFDDVHGRIDAAEHFGERGALVGRDEHRAHRVTRPEQRADDDRTLGDEETSVFLDAPPQIGVGQIDVVGDSSVVGSIDRYGVHLLEIIA
jgi:hypothetical protein